MSIYLVKTTEKALGTGTYQDEFVVVDVPEEHFVHLHQKLATYFTWRSGCNVRPISQLVPGLPVMTYSALMAELDRILQTRRDIQVLKETVDNMLARNYLEQGTRP